MGGIKFSNVKDIDVLLQDLDLIQQTRKTKQKKALKISGPLFVSRVCWCWPGWRAEGCVVTPSSTETLQWTQSHDWPGLATLSLI